MMNWRISRKTPSHSITNPCTRRPPGFPISGQTMRCTRIFCTAPACGPDSPTHSRSRSITPSILVTNTRSTSTDRVMTSSSCDLMCSICLMKAIRSAAARESESARRSTDSAGLYTRESLTTSDWRSALERSVEFNSSRQRTCGGALARGHDGVVVRVPGRRGDWIANAAPSISAGS